MNNKRRRNINKFEPPRKKKKFILSPKKYVLMVLLLLMGISLMKSGTMGEVINTGASMLTALILDAMIGIYQNRKKLFSDGGIVTGLIVALVLSSFVSWYISALTTAIAILSKHLFKIKRKPVFNPAAFGLLVSIYLFSSGQSWWGGLSTLPGWFVIFLLIGGFLVTKKVNKFLQVFAYLGTTFILVLTFGIQHNEVVGDILRMPYINATLFMAFFMLTDPPTSPSKYVSQVFFGMMTAIISVLIYLKFGGIQFLLIGLLVANGWNALRSVLTKKPVKKTALEALY